MIFNLNQVTSSSVDVYVRKKVLKFRNRKAVIFSLKSLVTMCAGTFHSTKVLQQFFPYAIFKRPRSRVGRTCFSLRRIGTNAVDVRASDRRIWPRL